MQKLHAFPDGSSLHWKDRETWVYVEDGRKVSIWMDYEPGWFSRGRVIRDSQNLRWEETPPGSSDLIDERKRGEILSKVQEYCRIERRPCRIAECR